MKSILYLTLSLVLVISCNKDNANNNEEALIGKWQVIEYCENTGAGDWTCRDIENGSIVDFNKNGIFTYNEGNNTECLTGSFTFNNTNLTLQFNSNLCSENDGIVIYIYTFIENKLQLRPSIENLYCDEGCYEVFKKINSD